MTDTVPIDAYVAELRARPARARESTAAAATTEAMASIAVSGTALPPDEQQLLQEIAAHEVNGAEAAALLLAYTRAVVKRATER